MISLPSVLELIIEMLWESYYYVPIKLSFQCVRTNYKPLKSVLQVRILWYFMVYITDFWQIVNPTEVP